MQFNNNNNDDGDDVSWYLNNIILNISVGVFKIISQWLGSK